MRVGVLRETKVGENRVALLPSGARALTERDHEVFIETQAGLGSGFPDNAYEEVGAKIDEAKGKIGELRSSLTEGAAPVTDAAGSAKAELKAALE